jgi:hypothetical protein
LGWVITSNVICMKHNKYVCLKFSFSFDLIIRPFSLQFWKQSDPANYGAVAIIRQSDSPTVRWSDGPTVRQSDSPTNAHWVGS